MGTIMSALIGTYLVFAVIGFFTCCIVTLMAMLDGYDDEAMTAARIALCSIVWPIALPLALIVIAMGKHRDKTKT